MKTVTLKLTQREFAELLGGLREITIGPYAIPDCEFHNLMPGSREDSIMYLNKLADIRSKTFDNVDYEVDNNELFSLS